MTREAFALRLAVYYGALFIIYGVQVPFLPVWLHWRGLTPPEIAAVAAAPFFLRLVVTPLIALYADETGRHRDSIIALSWFALAAGLLLSQQSSFLPILLTAVPMAVAASTVMPLTETVAVAGIRRRGLDYGRVRLWGSLTFILVGIAGGLMVDAVGAGIAIWLLVLGAAATVAAAHYLPPRESEGADVPTRRLPARAEALRLVSQPQFLLFLVAAGAIQGAHATFYTFGSLHWREQGISGTWVGGLWAVGVLAEVALFAWSAPVLARLGPVRLMVAGAAAAVLRWAAMSADPPLAALVVLQLFHALTYAASHLGAIHFITAAVPDGAAGTAQALYATVAAGLVHGLATLAAGPLYKAFGGEAYLGAAVLAAVGLAAAIELMRRWDGGPLWTAAQHRESAAS